MSTSHFMNYSMPRIGLGIRQEAHKFRRIGADGCEHGRVDEDRWRCATDAVGIDRPAAGLSLALLICDVGGRGGWIERDSADVVWIGRGGCSRHALEAQPGRSWRVRQGTPMELIAGAGVEAVREDRQVSRALG